MGLSEREEASGPPAVAWCLAVPRSHGQRSPRGHGRRGRGGVATGRPRVRLGGRRRPGRGGRTQPEGRLPAVPFHGQAPGGHPAQAGTADRGHLLQRTADGRAELTDLIRRSPSGPVLTAGGPPPPVGIDGPPSDSGVLGPTFQTG